MNKKLYIFILFFWMVAMGITAQINNEVNTPNRINSDRITDLDGAPLSGIQIRINGTNIYTITDVDGRFSLDAKNGDVIVLSKNGRLINTYRLDEGIYYKVDDSSNIIEVQETNEEKRSSVSKKMGMDKTFQFEMLIDSAGFFKRRTPTKSIDFIESALKIANETKNKKQIAESYGVLGDVNMNLKQFDLAVSNYLIAVDNDENTSYQLKLAKSFLLNNDYQNSEKQYNILLAKRGISTIQKIEIYEGLGDVYLKLDKHLKALNQYETALTLAKRISSISQITNLNSKIANSLEAKGETDKAEGYLLNSQSSVSTESPKVAAIKSKRAADFYSRNKNINKEVVQRKETLKSLEDADLEEVIIEDEGISITKPKAKLDLGNAYLKQNKINDAISILEESAAEAENTNDIETQKNAVQKLSEAYVSLGDDDKALNNYKKYVSLVDKLYKQKEKEINDAIILNRDLSEKQNRIISLEKDRELSESKLQLYQTENRLTIENDRRQRLIIYALLAGLILLIFSLFWMLKSNRQRKLANNLLALKSLRTQMNPHFIFNALNSVNSFIAQNDERTANRYLTDFSTLMRNVLENSEEDFILLEKEVELLELYLKLEHSRFKDKFDYELIVDEAIEQSQFLIPPMLLQPYVENAVWHGLRYKKEKGFLKVQLMNKGEETIRIEISDNGIGREKSKELKTDYQKKQRSKGMQNIKQRIAILNEMYKDKVDVFIEDLYDDKTGTKVILTLKKD